MQKKYLLLCDSFSFEGGSQIKWSGRVIAHQVCHKQAYYASFIKNKNKFKKSKKEERETERKKLSVQKCSKLIQAECNLYTSV